jgi:hypothetical protein
MKTIKRLIRIAWRNLKNLKNVPRFFKPKPKPTMLETILNEFYLLASNKPSGTLLDLRMLLAKYLENMTVANSSMVSFDQDAELETFLRKSLKEISKGVSIERNQKAKLLYGMRLICGKIIWKDRLSR